MKFKKGDIIEWCGERFEIIDCTDNYGTVKSLDGLEIISHFKFDYMGETSKIIKVCSICKEDSSKDICDECNASMLMQEDAEMEEAMEEWGKSHNKYLKNQNKLLIKIGKKVKNQKGGKKIWKKVIEEYLDESMNTCDYSLSKKKPEFKHERTYYDGLKEWVDQYVNGGHSGDTFEGWCILEVVKDKYYFKFRYEE